MTAAVNLATVGSNATTTGTLLTAGTAVTTTSGTSVAYTSIPSWVKRITMSFNGVSSSGSSNWQIQLGSGSYTASGYSGAWLYAGPGTVGGTGSTGFIFYHDTPQMYAVGQWLLV